MINQAIKCRLPANPWVHSRSIAKGLTKIAQWLHQLLSLLLVAKVDKGNKHHKLIMMFLRQESTFIFVNYIIQQLAMKLANHVIGGHLQDTFCGLITLYNLIPLIPT